MTRLILSLALLCWSAPAWAFSNTFRVAGADVFGPPDCCTTVTETSNFPMTVKNIVSTGGAVIYWTRMPNEVSTQNITMRITRFAPDSSDGKNFCEIACAGVVKDGETLTDLNVTACLPIVNNVVAAQWTMMEERFGDVPDIAPKDTTGTACDQTLNDCRGAALGIFIYRYPSENCVPPVSDNTISYETVTVIFDQ